MSDTNVRVVLKLQSILQLFTTSIHTLLGKKSGVIVCDTRFVFLNIAKRYTLINLGILNSGQHALI